MILIFSSCLNIIFLYLNYGLISFGISILIATILVNATIAIKVYKNYKINLFIPKVSLSIYSRCMELHKKISIYKNGTSFKNITFYSSFK